MFSETTTPLFAFKIKIIPSKLEVAPPPKCLSGVGDWIPLKLKGLL